MSNITLSEARVRALRPRPSACDIRDAMPLSIRRVASRRVLNHIAPGYTRYS